MDITVCAAFNDVAYRVGWVSLQPGGDVSVGLNARALVTPDFEAKEFVWSAFNRIQVAYFVPEDPRAAKPLMEPHLTFHAPDYLHLTAKNKKGKGKPFEAIAPIELAVRQQGVVPWVRFISRRVGLLAQVGAAMGGTRHRQHVVTFQVPSLECSVKLAVDFVAQGDATPDTGVLGTEWFDNGPYRLRISAAEARGQQYATLGWLHES